MTTVSINCPKCGEEDSLEFSHFAGSFMDPPEDDMDQQCSCEFSDVELDTLMNQAWNEYGEKEAEAEARYQASLCKVCGGEGEHDWEVHNAELRAVNSDY